MQFESFACSGIRLSLFSRGNVESLVYCHCDESRAQELFESLSSAIPETAGFGIVSVSGGDYANIYSPWPAKAVFKNEADFGGNAQRYLEMLSNEIIPAAEKTFGISNNKRSIAGYSLAGLFSIYAVYNTDIFSSAASVSGSLWFDGFTDYLAERRPAQNLKKVYLSVGSKESKTKNPRMATVENSTRLTAELLNNAGVETKLEINPGNHFFEAQSRMQKALLYLLNA